MIAAGSVFDAARTAVAAAMTVPVGLHLAPKGNPPEYVVIEAPPGTQREGSLGDGHSDASVRIRVRGVARSASVDQAARAAMYRAGQAAATLAGATLTGVGWVLGGAAIDADGGTDTQGEVANHTIDVVLLVVAAPVTPTP